MWRCVMLHFCSCFGRLFYYEILFLFSFVSYYIAVFVIYMVAYIRIKFSNYWEYKFEHLNIIYCIGMLYIHIHNTNTVFLLQCIIL